VGDVFGHVTTFHWGARSAFAERLYSVIHLFVKFDKCFII
jgi:hypothetical protein